MADKATKIYIDALERLADGRVTIPAGCLSCNWNGNEADLVDGICPCCRGYVYIGLQDFAAAVLNQGADTLF